MRANMNTRMSMTTEMKAELLRDLAGLLPREERAERERERARKGRRGRPISCPLMRVPPLNECGACRHFLFTHRSNRSGNAWGRCRRFGTPVGRYGKACQEFSPSNYAGDRNGYR